MKINAAGYWEDMSPHDIQEEHVFDVNLCVQIKSFLKGENTTSVADLGCGLGNYTNELNKDGIIQCDGFDGNPKTPVLTNDMCKVMDLSKPCVFGESGKTYNWVLSLEVGEHIPKEYEHIYIDNICNTAEHGIILSWAIKGQGGMGHVNCQNNDYIINVIERKGFAYDKDASNVLRKKATLSWFKNTIMVFRRT